MNAEDVWGTGRLSLIRFALYFRPENLRPPPNSKVCARDAHSNLVFLHFPRLSDLSLFFLWTPMGTCPRMRIFETSDRFKTLCSPLLPGRADTQKTAELRQKKGLTLSLCLPQEPPECSDHTGCRCFGHRCLYRYPCQHTPTRVKST